MRNLPVKVVITIVLLLVLVAMIFMVACNSPRETTTSTTSTIVTSSTTSISTTLTTIPITQTTQASYSAGLFIKPVPKIGETTELTFSFQIFDPDYVEINKGLEDSQAWIEFWWTNPWGSYLEAKQAVRIPVEEVVISGDTTWEGNYKEKGHLELHCIVQLPREGIWRIEGYFTGEGWKKPICGYREVVVSKDIAAQLNSDELKSSPLAYLTNFDYGFLKDSRKLDYLTEDTRPESIELDISKAPKVREEVTLTCTVASLHDVANWSMQIDFYRRLADNSLVKVQGTELLVKGELQWQGDLKQTEPTVFSTTIKFPEDGDWEIDVNGNSLQSIENQKAGAADYFQITISSAISYYGWKPQYFTPTTKPTQNIPITTTTITGTQSK